MSHNKLTIGTATGNRVSSVPLKTVHLNDVSSVTPNNGEFLSWNGSNWVSSSIGGGTALTATVVAWVGGHNTAYSIGSNMMPAVGNFYYMSIGQSYYRPLYYHDQTNATWYVQTSAHIAFTLGSGAVWCDRVELTAGTYLLRAQHIVAGGTNPWVDVQWQTEAGVALSPIRRISSIFRHVPFKQSSFFEILISPK